MSPTAAVQPAASPTTAPGPFDGVWAGRLHNVSNCNRSDVVLYVESNRLTTTIDGRKVNAEVGSDGTVSWRARGRGRAWGGGILLLRAIHR